MNQGKCSAQKQWECVLGYFESKHWCCMLLFCARICLKYRSTLTIFILGNIQIRTVICHLCVHVCGCRYTSACGSMSTEARSWCPRDPPASTSLILGILVCLFVGAEHRTQQSLYLQAWQAICQLSRLPTPTIVRNDGSDISNSIVEIKGLYMKCSVVLWTLFHSEIFLMIACK